MNLVYKARQLYPDEVRVLKSLKTHKEKTSRGKIKPKHFLVAGLIGSGFTYIATLIGDSFWVLPFGTIAALAFSFILFAPYEIFKMRRENREILKSLNEFINKGTVSTCIINATRIAKAAEFEDETDLYIAELSKDKVLYLWDIEYNLNKKLPCLQFEIYEEKFYKVTGKQIYSLSEKVKPVKIDKQAKWNYMKHIGVPEYLETKNINFDDLIEKYNNCT